MLGIIDRYQAMPPAERLKFRLMRRVRSYLGVYGVLTSEMDSSVKAALAAIEAGSPEATSLVDRVISTLKDRFV